MKKGFILFLSLVFVLIFSLTTVASEKGSPKGSEMKHMKGSEMGEYKGSPMGSPKGSMPQGQTGVSAVAQITGTTPDSKVSGIVRFIDTGAGVLVMASLSGVTPPGKHGIHIHQNGSCDDGGKAAGGHYNPKEVKHGFLPEDGHEGAHYGDMGNIEINDQGSGALGVMLQGLTVSGENGIVGRSVILHAKEDDFGQPTGNAGARIGCGIINSAAK